MFAASPPVEAEGVALATEAGSQLEQGAPPASLSTEAAGSQLPATKINTGMSKTSEKIMKPVHAADTTLRRSNRMQARNDEHTLKKTTRLAERRNLEGNRSFASFSDSRISSNLDKLGVSLGRDDNFIKSSTIAIKNIEIDRLVVTTRNKVENKNKKNVKINSTSNITDFSDDEGEERLEKC